MFLKVRLRPAGASTEWREDRQPPLRATSGTVALLSASMTCQRYSVSSSVQSPRTVFTAPPAGHVTPYVSLLARQCEQSVSVTLSPRSSLWIRVETFGSYSRFFPDVSISRFHCDIQVLGSSRAHGNTAGRNPFNTSSCCVKPTAVWTHLTSSERQFLLVNKAEPKASQRSALR